MIHGHGVRDCHEVFKVAPQTVLNLIERFGSTCQIPIAKKHYHRVIIDEFYTFVGHKGKKVWLFYAYAPETKEILAFTMGKRNTQQVRYLMLKIKHLRIKIDTYCTDAFEGFKKVLKRYEHLIGKQHTQAIEGRNTCLRARIARFQRRSTKFSKKLKYQWWLFTIFVHSLNSRASYI